MTLVRMRNVDLGVSANEGEWERACEPNGLWSETLLDPWLSCHKTA